VSVLDLVIDAAVFAWVLYRQRRVRRVRLRFAGRVPVVLLLIGLVQFIHYTESRSLGTLVSLVALGSCVVGGAVFGALRAYTVRLIPLQRDALAQQASWLTIGLWAVSVGAHLAVGVVVAGLNGPTGVIWASVLLYLAISLGVQNTIVHRRAVGFLMRGPGMAGLGANVVDARSWEEPRD
jgi:hypothetical protein